MPEPKVPDRTPPGELSGLIGRYQIVRPLGKGAMGQVYQAHDPNLDRDVAVKVMIGQFADDPEAKQRFEREAKAVAKMQHPNVVSVFDRGYHTDGSPWIVMEYLKGQDLQKRLRQPPPLPLERKVAIVVQVLTGLAHAHQAGIVHRDIKPANIWIQEDGSAKIMDFGVARDEAGSMTGTGNIIGTADYMSPEQAQGKKVDQRSDLFSVGSMLYELITGRRPFHAEGLMAIFYKLLHEDADYSLVPPSEPYQALVPILRKALARDANERYARAYDFAVDLREWLKAHGSAASHGVLAEMVDLEAPTHAPQQMTEVPGATARPGAVTSIDAGPTVIAATTVDGGATVETGARPGSGSLRRAGAPPAARAGGRPDAGPSVRSGPPRPATARPPARVQPASGPSLLPWLALGLALVAVVVAGVLFWRAQQAPAAAPGSLAAAPATTPAAPPTTLAAAIPTPPPTPAPQPTFAEAQGKASASIRAAQSAFRSGSYDRAVAAAQDALREDPGNASAQKVLDSALAGQRAALELRAGETALAQGDFAGADAHAEAARRSAPWDTAPASLATRVAEARSRAERDVQAKAQQARAGQLNALLNEAASAMERKQFEAALAAYNRALEIDPGNAVAQTGKSNAVTARTVAEAAAGAGRPAAVARSFVAGRTEAKGGEGTGGLVGFEESAGVVVKKGTQAAELPGRIVFDASPSAPKAGERYRISVLLANEGTQPIQLASMSVATTVDGRRQAGSLPPAATTVAPGARAPVWQSPGDLVWRDGTSSWTMEVLLQTTKGETYRNTLSWK